MSRLLLTGLVAAPDATVFYKETMTGTNPVELGKEVAAKLTEQGAFDLIQQVKAELRCLIRHPLKGKTVVVTGSSVTTTVLQKIEQLGGEAISCPLIKTVEIVEPYDHMQLEMARNFDWLIFTSQNAVEAFCAKMIRHKFTPSHFKGKIAAVGSKTKDKLVINGFKVDFVPSIFSADVFVKEFPKFAEPKSRCLFVRGKMAKDTIKNGLPFMVIEWNVYDNRRNKGIYTTAYKLNPKS